jgi:hypothetical protein
LRLTEAWRAASPPQRKGYLAWTGDGRAVVATAAGKIRVLDGATGRQRFAIGCPSAASRLGPRSLAASPDGRLFAAGFGGREGRVRVWEAACGVEALDLAGDGGDVARLAFAPDGSTLAAAGVDATAVLWDVALARSTRDAADADLARAWASLDSTEIGHGYRAMRQLAHAGPRGVAAIERGLRGAIEHDRRVRDWIDDLGHDRFAVRDAATRGLKGEGFRALPYLKAARPRQSDPEARARLEAVLEYVSALDVPPVADLCGEPLRLLRAAQVLASIGGDEARRVLRTLADGDPNGPAGELAR